MKPNDIEIAWKGPIGTLLHSNTIQNINIYMNGTEHRQGNREPKEIEDHSGMTDRKAIEQLRELSLEFYQFDRENGGSWRPKDVADTLDEICQYLGARL